jgi:hypothetical protein
MPFGCAVPEVVTGLAKCLDVLWRIVADVLVEMMRVKACCLSARFAGWLQVFPRPPTVSVLRQADALRVRTSKRAEFPPLKCRCILQPSIECFAE